MGGDDKGGQMRHLDGDIDGQMSSLCGKRWANEVGGGGDRA